MNILPRSKFIGKEDGIFTFEFNKIIIEAYFVNEIIKIDLSIFGWKEFTLSYNIHFGSSIIEIIPIKTIIPISIATKDDMDIVRSIDTSIFMDKGASSMLGINEISIFLSDIENTLYIEVKHGDSINSLSDSYTIFERSINEFKIKDRLYSDIEISMMSKNSVFSLMKLSNPSIIDYIKRMSLGISKSDLIKESTIIGNVKETKYLISDLASIILMNMNIIRLFEVLNYETAPAMYFKDTFYISGNNTISVYGNSSIIINPIDRFPDLNIVKDSSNGVMYTSNGSEITPYDLSRIVGLYIPMYKRISMNNSVFDIIFRGQEYEEVIIEYGDKTA